MLSKYFVKYWAESDSEEEYSPSENNVQSSGESESDLQQQLRSSRFFARHLVNSDELGGWRPGGHRLFKVHPIIDLIISCFKELS